MSDSVERIETDAVVVGAGLAGTSLALRLARRGARVVLVEAHSLPRDKLCGEYLSPEGVEALDRLGIGPAVAAAGGHEIRRVRLTTPRGAVVEAEVGPPDAPPGLGLGRRTLDAILIDAARAAGVLVLDATRVSGPVVRGGTVRGVEARDATLRTIAVLAPLVVAADGRHSHLASQTGRMVIRTRLRPRHFGLKRHVIARDGPTTEPEGTVGLHLVAGGYVGACRIEGGRANICGLLPEALLKPHRGDLDALAAAVFPRNPALGRQWAGAEPAGEWKTVAGVRVVAARPAAPGLLLTGDARGTVDPLGGQGMTMALMGAELLEPFALEAIGAGGASAGIQSRAGAAWSRRFGRRVALCRAFHQALVRPWLLDGLARFEGTAARLVAAAYHLTRDPRRG